MDNMRDFLFFKSKKIKFRSHPNKENGTVKIESHFHFKLHLCLFVGKFTGRGLDNHFIALDKISLNNDISNWLETMLENMFFFHISFVDEIYHIFHTIKLFITITPDPIWVATDLSDENIFRDNAPPNRVNKVSLTNYSKDTYYEIYKSSEFHYKNNTYLKNIYLHRRLDKLRGILFVLDLNQTRTENLKIDIHHKFEFIKKLNRLKHVQNIFIKCTCDQFIKFKLNDIIK